MVGVEPELLTPAQAGELLRTTAPTVRKLHRQGVLKGPIRVTKSGREVRRISRESVDVYLKKHGSFAKQHAPALRDILERIDQLSARIDALAASSTVSAGAAPAPSPQPSAPTEPATLTLADLTEILRLQRAGTALVRDADEARAKVVSGLMDALQAAELADEKRRQALLGLETILTIILTPESLPRLQ